MKFPQWAGWIARLGVTAPGRRLLRYLLPVVNPPILGGYQQMVYADCRVTID